MNNVLCNDSKKLFFAEDFDATMKYTLDLSDIQCHRWIHNTMTPDTKAWRHYKPLKLILLGTLIFIYLFTFTFIFYYFYYYY